jgi:dihydrofolate reductase
MALPNFSLIVAVDSNFGIGKNNTIPWYLPSDLKRFAKITKGDGKNTVVMGRKTWESLPETYRPLPGRQNVVITSNKGYIVPSGVSIHSSLDEALQSLENKDNDSEIFVIGGGQLYAHAITLPQCNKIYVTKMSHNFDCTVFFPAIPNDFSITEQSEAMTENEQTFTYITYQR